MGLKASIKCESKIARICSGYRSFLRIPRYCDELSFHLECSKVLPRSIKNLTNGCIVDLWKEFVVCSHFGLDVHW